MALYSASQLLDKTFVVEFPINVYKVIDIINLGDNAHPVGSLLKDQTFVMYSFLLPTLGYTDIYNIHYAKRTDLYFTFFVVGGENMCVKVKNDGRFSIQALRDQGALTVKEELEQEKYENLSWWEKLSLNFGGGLKTVLIIGAVALGAGYVITRRKRKE